MRPEASPARKVRLSGAAAQAVMALSPPKAAISRPVARSQSLRVWSLKPEMARLPSGVTAAALTGVAFQGAEQLAGLLRPSGLEPPTSAPEADALLSRTRRQRSGCLGLAVQHQQLVRS